MLIVRMCCGLKWRSLMLHIKPCYVLKNSKSNGFKVTIVTYTFTVCRSDERLSSLKPLLLLTQYKIKCPIPEVA